METYRQSSLSIVGQRFGKLIVLGLCGKDPISGASLCLCRCDCGQEPVVRRENLKRGYTRSCGCLKKERDYQRSPLLELKQKQKPLAEWAKQLGLSSDGLRYRLRRGWTLERALTTPKVPKTTKRRGP